MQSVDAKVAPQLIDYVRLMAQGMVDQSWAEKMLKFLDKFESELKTLREEKKFIVSEHFLDIMTKGYQIYALAANELCGQIFLSGFGKMHLIVRRISRGYSQLMNTMLKYCIKQFQQKSDHLEDIEVEKRSYQPLTKEEAQKKAEESILNGNFYSDFLRMEPNQQNQTNQNHENKHPKLLIETAKMGTTTTTHGTSPVTSYQISLPLGMNSPSSPQSRNLSMNNITDMPHTQTASQGELNEMDKVSFALPEKVENQYNTLPVTQFLSPDITREHPKQSNINSSELIPDEDELELQREFESIMKERRKIRKIEPSGTERQLNQVLRSLANTKRKARLSDLLVTRDEDDRDDLDFHELQTDLIDSIAKKQKSVTKKALTIAEKNELERLRLRKKQQSVGTDPDYKIIEAERKAFFADRESEYERIISGLKEEIANLKKRLEELNTNYNDSKGKLLNLKNIEATMTVEKNKLQNELRLLKEANGALKKKEKEKPIERSSRNLLAPKVTEQDKTASLIEENVKLTETISLRDAQIEEMKAQNIKRADKLMELEHLIKAKVQIIEQNDKDLLEREATIKDLGQQVNVLTEQKNELQVAVEHQKSKLQEQAQKIVELTKVRKALMDYKLKAEEEWINHKMKAMDQGNNKVEEETKGPEPETVIENDSEIKRQRKGVTSKERTLREVIEAMTAGPSIKASKYQQNARSHLMEVFRSVSNDVAPDSKPDSEDKFYNINTTESGTSLNNRLDTNEKLQTSMTIYQSPSTDSFKKDMLLPRNALDTSLNQSFNGPDMNSRFHIPSNHARTSSDISFIRQGRPIGHFFGGLTTGEKPIGLFGGGLSTTEKPIAFAGRRHSMKSIGMFDPYLAETPLEEGKMLVDMYYALQRKLIVAPSIAHMFRMEVIRRKRKKISASFDGAMNDPQDNIPGIPGILALGLIDKQHKVAFSDFKEYFLRFRNAHLRCGKECLHLRRFYEKIGWNPSGTVLKYSMSVPKTVVNKLPEINSRYGTPKNLSYGTPKNLSYGTPKNLSYGTPKNLSYIIPKNLNETTFFPF